MASSLAGLLQELSGESPLTASLVSSLFAAAMTTLGGLLVLFARDPPGNSGGNSVPGGRLGVFMDAGMGFSSGVMMVASFTSLLLPAIELAGPATPLAGFVLGALAIHVVNKSFPHKHLVKGFEGPEELWRKIRTAWLIAIAIIIHNLPEGMAIGASAAYSIPLGVATGIAIGFQDIPEGLAVALPVYASTGSMRLAMLISMLSGLSEVATALPTTILAGSGVLPLALALGFSAGAMVYVVSHEALPESHRSGHETPATVGFFIGFLVMIVLDTMLKPG